VLLKHLDCAWQQVGGRKKAVILFPKRNIPISVFWLLPLKRATLCEMFVFLQQHQVALAGLADIRYGAIVQAFCRSLEFFQHP
jgi:hypothetical protein